MKSLFSHFSYTKRFMVMTSSIKIHHSPSIACNGVVKLLMWKRLDVIWRVWWWKYILKTTKSIKDIGETLFLLSCSSCSIYSLNPTITLKSVSKFKFSSKHKNKHHRWWRCWTLKYLNSGFNQQPIHQWITHTPLGQTISKEWWCLTIKQNHCSYAYSNYVLWAYRWFCQRRHHNAFQQYV